MTLSLSRPIHPKAEFFIRFQRERERFIVSQYHVCSQKVKSFNFHYSVLFTVWTIGRDEAFFVIYRVTHPNFRLESMFAFETSVRSTKFSRAAILGWVYFSETKSGPIKSMYFVQFDCFFSIILQISKFSKAGSLFLSNVFSFSEIYSLFITKNAQ